MSKEPGILEEKTLIITIGKDFWTFEVKMTLDRLNHNICVMIYSSDGQDYSSQCFPNGHISRAFVWFYNQYENFLADDMRKIRDLYRVGDRSYSYVICDGLLYIIKADENGDKDVTVRVNARIASIVISALTDFTLGNAVPESIAISSILDPQIKAADNMQLDSEIIS